MTEQEILAVSLATTTTLCLQADWLLKLCAHLVFNIVSGIEVEGHSNAPMAYFTMQRHDGNEFKGGIGLGGGRSEEKIISVLRACSMYKILQLTTHIIRNMHDNSSKKAWVQGPMWLVMYA